MFYDDELTFLRNMLSKCHLQNFIIDPQKTLDDGIDKGLRRLFTNENIGQIFMDFFPDMKSRTVYRVTDGFFCRYIFLELPTYDEKKVFILGPYINIDISREQILELGERMGISPKLFKELEYFYAALPVIKEENHIFAMINTFAEFIWSGSDKYESMEINRENAASFILGEFASREDSDDSMSDIYAMEKRYQFENELIMAVSQGNIHKAELMMTSFSTLAFENRVSDQLRNIKNYCIIMNTLLRKAAESGGVHPVYLDSVSSDFAKKIENIHSMEAIPDFMLNIMRTYCNLVRKHSIKDYSPLVQNVIIRIESDLTSDLSLSALARVHNVSAGYLSGLFKKETGRTLTEYVNGRRIHRAKHLLRTTNLQIQTIAQHCGVLDFHYFCRIFKNATGKTPTEYRSAQTF